MRANFAFSTLTATALIWAASASAAVLTATPATPTLSGVAAAAAPAVTPPVTTTATLDNSYGSTSTTHIEKDVQVAPTATSSGLAYVYEVTTVTQTRTDTLASQDYYSWNQALTGNTAGTEFLTLSVTLTPSQSLGAMLSLYSTGSYAAVASPFGSSVPALPSYYFRLAGASAWTLLGSTNTTNAATGSFYGGESAQLALTAGVATSFEVAVLAGSNVDLSDVGLNLWSDYYDTHKVAVDLGTSTTKALVGAELLAPVPEPQTYALILAGLLFVGLRLRSRQ
ncbi:PEP-CTERM sorting domain-containing protein [Roseateles sp. BYS78W]|uniref:PEP-CTERM sorting domain-containing protein n=1 Tax=Pelomonas candidula TaxID=3299025 RepID=A0ABW7HAL9_9BURK